MSQFDTGDNLSTGLGALRDAVQVLEKMGYKFLRPLGDLKGTYGYILQYQGVLVYMVARRARPFVVEGIRYISSQKQLINYAVGHKSSCILVAMMDPDEVRFFLFDPHELKEYYGQDLISTGFDNTRHSVRMLNYEWDLGMEINPLKLQSRLIHYRSMKGERRRYVKVNQEPEKKAGQQTELTDEGLQLRTTVHQHMESCETHGLYPDKLDECPECKRAKEGQP